MVWAQTFPNGITESRSPLLPQVAGESWFDEGDLSGRHLKEPTHIIAGPITLYIVPVYCTLFTTIAVLLGSEPCHGVRSINRKVKVR